LTCKDEIREHPAIAFVQAFIGHDYAVQQNISPSPPVSRALAAPPVPFMVTVWACGR
jgi:hypothetical protein